MASGQQRSPSEVLKRGYSDEEVANIYCLGRLYLENGQLHQAENIMQGLTEVAPEFAPGWLAICYIHVQKKNYELSINAARQALRLELDMTEAMLFLVACLLTTGDYNSAGTYLGEIGEKIEAGAISLPEQIRFYNTQLARYESRG